MKVVVVVSPDRKEWFEGENIKVAFTDGMSVANVKVLGSPLQIMKGDTVIAQFEKWEYWRFTE